MKKKVRGIYILLCFCVFTPLVLQAQTDEEKRILQEREEISKQKKGGSVVVDERTALELFDNTPSFGISGIIISLRGCLRTGRLTNTVRMPSFRSVSGNV